MKRYLWGLLPVMMLSACHAKPQEARSKEAQPVSVKLALPQREKIVRRLALNGTVTARSEVKIVPKLSGRVLQVLAEEGDTVEKGALLAKLETTELEWQLQQQQASLLTAQANFEKATVDVRRTKELYEQGATSLQHYEGTQTQLKIAVAQVRQLRAAIEQVKAQLAHGQVRSPIQGTVLVRHTETGSMAGPGTPMFTVAEAGNLRVTVQVPEQELASLHVGAPAEITSTAFPGKAFAARVGKINPSVNPQTRLIKVQLDLAPSELRIGMFVQASIMTEAREGTVIPAAALQSDEKGSYVFVNRQKQARYLAVQPGVRMGDRIEVVSGLSGKEAVVILGGAFMKDGDRIDSND